MFTCLLKKIGMRIGFLIIVLSLFFKDGEYYYEAYDSVRGERTFEYKEGKLVKQQFKPY